MTQNEYLRKRDNLNKAIDLSILAMALMVAIGVVALFVDYISGFWGAVGGTLLIWIYGGFLSYLKFKLREQYYADIHSNR
jgi:hypothetical protein